MKICFLGAGALASALGGLLTEAGNEVWLVDHSPAHVDAINSRGLTLREDGVARSVAARARTSPDGIGPTDLVVVLVKSFRTREAIASAGSIVGPDTVVMSLQNGLGHDEILAEVVGRESVIAGKTCVGGVLLAPGHAMAGIRGPDAKPFRRLAQGRATRSAAPRAATPQSHYPLELSGLDPRPVPMVTAPLTTRWRHDRLAASPQARARTPGRRAAAVRAP